MELVRDVFSPEKDLGRRIEKVITYGAADEARLEAEVSEYQVEPSVERAFRTFLERFDEALRRAEPTEVGVWVSGFFGSGKSSFTKYLGLALARREIAGERFAKRLARRLPTAELPALLQRVADSANAAVFMIDLGTEQLVASTSVSVARVIEAKILREIGFSREAKVAELEMALEREGRLPELERAFAEEFPDLGRWEDIHNDPFTAVTCAAQLIGRVRPREWKADLDAAKFLAMHVQPEENITDLVDRLLLLVQKRTGATSLVLFVDEVGQYVAPRRDLILNLDGFVRALKERGRGRAWLVATAQQTLTEISSAAAVNSADLSRLKDRFPISITLEATDIAPITAKRLLEKSSGGETELSKRWRESGELLHLHAHLAGFGRPSELDRGRFLKLYPLLPNRFDLLLDLIRVLARRTGGIGLRSAIRVVQDLLVDTARMLPRDVPPIADRPLGTLVAADDLFDLLRHDLGKEYPHAVEGADAIAKDTDYGTNPLAVRVGKAVAVLSPFEDRPRGAEIVSALLYRELGSPGELEAVRACLRGLVEAGRFGLVEVAAGESSPGGFLFLSKAVEPFKRKRDGLTPLPNDLWRVRDEVLAGLFDPTPSATLPGGKTVTAALRFDRRRVSGDGPIAFVLEAAAGALDAKKDQLATESQSRDEHRFRITLLFAEVPDVEAHLREAWRSLAIREDIGAERPGGGGTGPEGIGGEHDREVQRFLRAERAAEARERAEASASYASAFARGWLVFRGHAVPVGEVGRGLAERGSSSPTIAAIASAFLGEAAADAFDKWKLVGKNVAADAARKLLDTEALPKTSAERDPLAITALKAGRPQIDVAHPALAEARAVLGRKVASAGTGRVPGQGLLEYFDAPPYGWTKDTTRLVFAALFRAGEVEVHGPEGVVRTAGLKAGALFQSNQSFSRIGVALRGGKPPLEALERAATRLELMFNTDVLPLEDQIARTVRGRFPVILDEHGALPARLRLLQLPGEERARRLLSAVAEALREDASNAVAVLGGIACDVPEDRAWVDRVETALAGDGESLIKDARAELVQIDRLARLHPGLATWLREGPAKVLADRLAAEGFADGMAELRQAAAQLEQRLGDEADRRDQVLLADLTGADGSVLARLEALPEWVRIGPDAREALKKRLDALARPAEGDAFARLESVLLRSAGVAGLEAEIRKELESRVPPIDGGDGTETGVEPGAGEAKAVPLNELHPGLVAIARVEDVDAYVKALRARLVARLRLGPFTLTGSRGGGT